jgi:hypothetical protein
MTHRDVSAALQQIPTLDPYEHARISASMIGYDSRWRDTEMEVFEVEHEWEMPLLSPRGRESRTWTLAGKIDAVVRVAGEVLVLEHKTSSEDISPGSDYWQRLHMDGQVSTYIESASRQYGGVSRCIYDVLGKPRLRPELATPVESRKYTKAGALYASQRDTDETPDAYHQRCLQDISERPEAYYQRGLVVRLERDMVEHRADLWSVAVTLREALREDVWPRNPEACTDRYRRLCAYYPVCTGAAELVEGEMYMRSELHPELSPPQEKK